MSTPSDSFFSSPSPVLDKGKEDPLERGRKFTSSYCSKCAHPHRLSVKDLSKALDCPTRLANGKFCRCRKFRPLPEKVASLQEWKDIFPKGDGPGPSSPFSPVGRKGTKGKYLRVDAVGKVLK